ncbi:MAG: BatD family protein [Candidatus Omnitrophica bacterium]|nr:BatD family protein [Candidatus Omnitrophota bacterium]MDD5611166.1 BatD family protein [Candidatus Omnitrophota bacterium]
MDKIRNLRIITIVLCLLILPALCLAQIEIKAEVDKQKIATGEELVYKVVITSGSEAITSLKFPDFKGFSVISQANTSDINIKGNAEKVGAIYIFILLPEKAGTFSIGPTEIKTKKATYKSVSFQIEVAQSSGSAPPAPQAENQEETNL